MNWINFLHIYQPPWQKWEVLDRMVSERYLYFLGLLEKYKRGKVTLNISGSLVELLLENDHPEVVQKIKKLTKKGQIELTGSAMYHPLLPLLKEDEIIRQIKLNEEISNRVFGAAWRNGKKKPAGFFIPEMAYSKKVAQIVVDFGYEWIILDEVALGGKMGNVDWGKKYEIRAVKNNQGKNLKVVFRNRKIYKKSFSGKTFDTIQIKELAKRKNAPEYIVTARDGESYGDGMWSKRKDKALASIMSDPKINCLTVSEYLKDLKEIEKINPVSCSWESLEKEIKSGEPYKVWASKDNVIHNKYWKLFDKVLRIVEGNKRDSNYKWSRHHLDRAMASCGMWWADGRFKGYNPEEIEKNATELVRAARSLKKLPQAKRIKIEKEYSDLIFYIWKKHWEIN